MLEDLEGDGELFAMRWNLHLFDMSQGKRSVLTENDKGKMNRPLGLVYRPSSVQVEIKASEQTIVLLSRKMERMMVGYH